MTNMTNYIRKFIILKKDYSNMEDVNPKGHGKLEVRGGNINFSVKIDNAEDNIYYNILFISGRNTYELGKIYTKDNRSGVAEFNLNQRELRKAGFSLESINAVLILREPKILLGGYFDKEDKSIDKYIHRLKEYSPADGEVKDDEEEITESESMEEEQVKEESTREQLEEVGSVEDIVPEEELDESEEFTPIEKTKDEKTDDADEEREVPTEGEYTEVMEEVFQDIEKDVPSSSGEDIFEEFSHKTYNEYQEEMARAHRNEKTLEYILNILNYFPYMKPFDINLEGYDWWKIDVTEPQEQTSFLPYFDYVIGSNHKYPGIKDSTTTQNLIKKYKHYLFGIYNENNRAKFFIYGVPGEFRVVEHPDKGDTGFNTWFKARDMGGYWLLYIDVATGRIIYPINPMKPID